MKERPTYLPLDNSDLGDRRKPQSSASHLSRRPFCLALFALGILLFGLGQVQRRASGRVDVITPAMTALRRDGFIYEAVPGFFVQDDPDTDPNTFDVYEPSFAFGRINASWPEFQAAFDDFKRSLDPNDSVKVIFAARHGQGYHNVAESQYGTEAWDCHWAMLNDDGKLFWGPDADLTPLGKDQARVAHKAWTRELANGAPFPESFLSSPMTRAADTLQITWNGQRGGQVKPLVRESWRETIGLHTCDKRRPASYIRKTFPSFTIEEGFTEEDELWTKDEQETNPQTDIRIRQALDGLFANDSSTYVSLTAHSGVIASLLRVVGHQPFTLQTGGMIPIVVRARPSSTTYQPDPGASATAPACQPTAGL